MTQTPSEYYAPTLPVILRSYVPQYGVIFVHSAFIALLALTPFLYMMQIHERVYLSRSWETLGFITLIVVGLMLTWAALVWLRGTALRAIGISVDTRLRARVYEAIHRARPANPMAYFQDVMTFRNGLTGSFVASLFDAMLSPVFVGVLFLLHPVFGLTAIAFIFAIALLTAVSAHLWRASRTRTKPLENEALAFGVASASHPDVIDSMYMLPGVRRKWTSLQGRASSVHASGQHAIGIIDALLALLRRSELVIIIGVGAILYLLDEITATTAFAAFIVMMRGVNPVLSVVQNWRVVGETRDAYDRIASLLTENAPIHRPSPGAIKGAISCRGLSVQVAKGKPILRNVSFDLPAGTCLGIVGPSGAGKSTLLKILAGVRLPHTGEIFIDGFDLTDWPEDQIGTARGYMPQTVDLFPGSIWENVARFAPYDEETNACVLEALVSSRAMEIVQARPDGLSMELANGGAPLSGGQRQRIGLARALYGAPQILVLDEPNAALDSEGEAALLAAITEAKARGATVIFSTHKASLLDACDYLLVMMDGYVHSFSTRDDILDRLQRGNSRIVGATGS